MICIPAPFIGNDHFRALVLDLGGSATGGTTLVATPTEKVDPNCMMVLYAIFNNSGTNGADPYVSIADSAGNTWTRRVNFHYDPGAANEGFSGGIFTAGGGTTLLANPTTVTITLSPGAGAQAYMLFKVNCPNGATPSYHSGGVGTGVASGTSASFTTTDLEHNHFLMALAVSEGYSITGDSDTTRGVWFHAGSVSIGSGLTGMEIFAQNKYIRQATGATTAPTQTYTATVDTACSMRCGWIALEAYDGDLSWVYLNTQSASGSGSGSVTSTSVYATGVGGGTLSYLWEYVSGDTLTIDSSTSSSTSFSYATLTATRVGVYRCKVTDSRGGIHYTENVTITLTYVASVTLNVYAKKGGIGNAQDIYYRVNLGSWVFGASVGSAICSNVFDITGLTNGDTVDFCTEDVGLGTTHFPVDNSATCSDAGASYADNRIGDCGTGYFQLTMGSTDKDVAIWCTALGCA